MVRNNIFGMFWFGMLRQGAVWSGMNYIYGALR